jgi:hypothetical protein
VKVHIQHLPHGRVVGISDRLSAREPTDSVNQYVELSKPGHDLLDQLTRAPSRRDVRHNRSKCRMCEIGLLDIA